LNYPIPGNDDAIRSINLFCKEIADAIIEGQTQKAEEEGEEVENAPQADAEFANKMLEAEKKIMKRKLKKLLKRQ